MGNSEIALVCILAFTMVIGGVLYYYKGVVSESCIHNDKIKTLIAKSVNVQKHSTSIEEIDSVMSEIKTAFERTPVMYKDIRSIYRCNYYILLGMKVILERNDTNKEQADTVR